MMNDPAMLAEIEDHNQRVLIPTIALEIPTMICTTPRTGLSDFRGAQTRVAGELPAEQVQALGMAPVSTAYTEVYEALQRGTVDCAATGLRVGDLGGFMELAKYVAVDPDTGFGSTPVPVTINQDTWDDLPLAAQQLMYDLIPHYLVDSAYSLLMGIKGAVETAVGAGGSVVPMDADAVDALSAFNDDFVAGVDAGDAVSEAAAKWLAVLTEEMGMEDVLYEDFLDFGYDRDKVDLEGWADQLYEAVILPQRPN
jgi:TRAP-type C4-dicarboxylate transport system substrate-binding protein